MWVEGQEEERTGGNSGERNSLEDTALWVLAEVEMRRGRRWRARSGRYRCHNPWPHFKNHAPVRDRSAMLGVVLVRCWGVAGVDGHVNVQAAFLFVDGVADGLVLSIVRVGPALIVGQAAIFLLGAIVVQAKSVCAVGGIAAEFRAVGDGRCAVDDDSCGWVGDFGAE